MASQQSLWVLSGGLASGKSKVRELLAAEAIVTIDADRVGHAILQPATPAFSEVASRWPGVVRDGTIDRSALASIVFNDAEELAALEAITHPYIFDTIRAQVEPVKGTVVVEIPLLGHLLGGEWKRIVVDSQDEVRLRRAVERGMTQDDARARMAAQPSRRLWLAAADVVIPNHSDISELESTVRRLASSL